MGDVLIQIINCHRRHRVLIKQFNCPLSISDAAANDGWMDVSQAALGWLFPLSTRSPLAGCLASEKDYHHKHFVQIRTTLSQAVLLNKLLTLRHLIFLHSVPLRAQLNVSTSVISSTLHSFVRAGITSLTFVLILFYFILFCFIFIFPGRLLVLYFSLVAPTIWYLF